MFKLVKSLAANFPNGITHHHLSREIVSAGITSCNDVYQNGDELVITFTEDYTSSLAAINSVISNYKPTPSYFDDLKFVSIVAADSPYYTTKSVKCDTTNGNITVLLPKTQRAKNGIFAIQKTAAAGTVTITPNGLETIIGAANMQLTDNKSYIVLKVHEGGWISALGSKIDVSANDFIDSANTVGDLLVDNGTESVPLHVGANGTILVADSSQALGLRWGSASGGATSCTEITSTAVTTTTSTSYVVMLGMTSTPSAGTYVVMFSSTLSVSSASAVVTYGVYVGGSLITHSERSYRGATSAISAIYSQAKVTVNGSQAVEIRYKTSTGTVTVNARNMEIVAVA
jgi:hypothetical protein